MVAHSFTIFHSAILVCSSSDYHFGVVAFISIANVFFTPSPLVVFRQVRTQLQCECTWPNFGAWSTLYHFLSIELICVTVCVALLRFSYLLELTLSIRSFFINELDPLNQAGSVFPLELCCFDQRLVCFTIIVAPQYYYWPCSSRIWIQFVGAILICHEQQTKWPKMSTNCLCRHDDYSESSKRKMRPKRIESNWLVCMCD